MALDESEPEEEGDLAATPAAGQSPPAGPPPPPPPPPPAPPALASQRHGGDGIAHMAMMAKSKMRQELGKRDSLRARCTCDRLTKMH